MRTVGLILGCVAVLAVALPAPAQQLAKPSDINSFLKGINRPQTMNTTPVNLGKFNKPINFSNAFKAAPTSMNATNTSRFFPKLSLGTWPPKFPNVSILPQSQNVFQPKVVGKNPFSLSPKK